MRRDRMSGQSGAMKLASCFPQARAARSITRLALMLVMALACIGVDCAYAETEDYALLADTHLGLPWQPPYDEVEEALIWATELGNLKAVCVAGDITDRGSPVSYGEWEFLCDSILGEVAHIQALGDHDTGKNGMYLDLDNTLTVANGYAYFKEMNGGSDTSYHEFEHANVMTVGGVKANGHSVITTSMLKTLNARLKKTARQGKVAIVVCHYPYDSGSLNKRSKLMGILRSYPNVVYVSGDRHTYAEQAQCQTVSPSCSTTPYSRTGIKRTTKYSFKSIGVNAVCTARTGDYSYADHLSISDDGLMSLEKWNLSTGTVDKTWSFKQAKSSVTVKAAPTTKRYPKSAKLTFRVTFSDGKTYGGVKSGATFKVKAGKSKKFGNIPSGVLVSVKSVKVPSRWTKPKAQSVEVGKSAKTLRMKASYKASKSAKKTKASKLRAS